jgi:hypothetical protein
VPVARSAAQPNLAAQPGRLVAGRAQRAGGKINSLALHEILAWIVKLKAKYLTTRSTKFTKCAVLGDGVVSSTLIWMGFHDRIATPARPRSWCSWCLGGRFFFALVVVLAVAPAARPAGAESPWSEPITVFSTIGRAAQPVVTADVQGDTHLFFVAAETRSAKVEPPRALMYARLHGERWSDPVRILTMPDDGAVNFPAATVDGRGLLHVVWQGGPLQRIHYSRATVEEADAPEGWRTPEVLSVGGEFGGGMRSDILVGPDGDLHLLYASQEGNVFHRRSVDAGDSWSPPVQVSNVGGGEASNYPRLAADTSGRLHATWTQFRLPKAWPPTGGYYGQSVDRGHTWTPPRRVAGENHGAVNVATQAGDRVHLVWNSVMSIGERLHQGSDDGGSRWSDVQRIALEFKGGFTGYPALAVDAADALHLVTALDGPAGKHGVIYYLAWSETGWSPAVLISQGAVGKRAVEWPSMTVSGGNHLRVVYSDDTERIWFTTRTTAAPSVAPRPFGERNIGHRPEWSIQLGLAALAALLIASRTVRGLRSWRRARCSRATP